MSSLEVLWEPIRIGTVEVRNRVALAAHGSNFHQDRYAAYLEARARGGTGLLFTGAMPVVPRAWWDDHMPGVGAVPTWSPDGLPFLRAAALAAHRHGARLSASTGIRGPIYAGTFSHAHWGPAWAPSELPHPLNGAQAKAIEQEDIDELIEGFALAAEIAREAGLDGMEVHGAHGYLLHQFLSPVTNQREDRYGGSLENRARLIVEIGAAIRERVGVTSQYR